ncbi:MAG TPA: Yip1 family protein [Steroidobacteraceae bacterium]
MDLNRTIERARAILLSPRSQWLLIAAEPDSVAGLYRRYILVLAAIAPVCAFIRISLIGYAWHGFRVYRLGVGTGLTAAIIWYVLILLTVYVLAIVVDAVAPNFAASTDRVRALQLVGYSSTAAWVAGFAQLLPDSLRSLLALAGFCYGLYLFYLGLPLLMRVPPERVAGYVATYVIIAVVLDWIVHLMTGSITGRAAFALGE